jgi:hypothetical protein
MTGVGREREPPTLSDVLTSAIPTGCEIGAEVGETPGMSEETALRLSRAPSNDRNARDFLEPLRMVILHPGGGEECDGFDGTVVGKKGDSSYRCVAAGVM